MARLVVLAVAVAVLAAGAPVAAGAQPAPRPGPRPATELAALPSNPPPAPAPEVPPGRFAGLQADRIAPPPSEVDARNRRPRPSAFDPARSTPAEAETTPTRKVYNNPDGTRTAELSSRPLRYRDGAGAWKDFDLTLVPGPDGSMGARSAPDAARLGAHAGGAVAVVGTPAGPITFGHPQGAPAAVAAGSHKATYPRALGAGRDLVLELTPDGFKENVVLADAATAPATYLDQFGLPPGVTARQAGAAVEFATAAGEVVGHFRGGIAFDASYPAAGLGAATPVGVRLVPTPPPPAPGPGAPAAPPLPGGQRGHRRGQRQPGVARQRRSEAPP